MAPLQHSCISLALRAPTLRGVAFLASFMSGKSSPEFFNKFSTLLARWRCNREDTAISEEIEENVSTAYADIKSALPAAALTVHSLLSVSGWAPPALGRNNWTMADGSRGENVPLQAQFDAAEEVVRLYYAHLVVNSTPVLGKRKAPEIVPLEEPPHVEKDLTDLWGEEIDRAAKAVPPPSILGAAQLKKFQGILDAAELIRAGGFPSGPPGPVAQGAPGGMGPHASRLPAVFQESLGDASAYAAFEPFDRGDVERRQAIGIEASGRLTTTKIRDPTPAEFFPRWMRVIAKCEDAETRRRIREYVDLLRYT